jgi:hypothetical protein
VVDERGGYSSALRRWFDPDDLNLSDPATGIDYPGGGETEEFTTEFSDPPQ